jgi:outer membrane protein TolC
MTLRIALAFLALAAAPALAQPKQPKQQPQPVADDMAEFEKDLDALFVHGGLTADQAAARAGSVSPTVHRRTAETEAAIANEKATELFQVPQILGKASYTRLSSIPAFAIPIGGMNVEIPFFNNQYILEGDATVNLSDYLLRYPKLIGSAQAGVDSARVNKKATEVSAGQDAKLAYYEWLRARLQVLVAQRQLTQVQTTLRQVRALAEVQRLSRADLMRVESQEATAEQTLDQLTNLAILREEQLRILIGAGNEPLSIGEDIRTDVAAPAIAPLDDAMSRARAQRLEYRVIDYGIVAKDKQRDAELANELPRLSAFGVMDYARPNSRFFPQTDQFKFTWQVGAQLTWTLNDPLTAQTTIRRLRAEASELRADRENFEHGNRVEVLAAQQAVAIAEHALVTSAKGLAAAEESYRVRKELLAADRATAVELVDAETDLTRARVTALNARVDLRVAMTQLSHALGDDTK